MMILDMILFALDQFKFDGRILEKWLFILIEAYYAC